METLLGLMIGVGLAAACGFRLFVPFLGMNIAAMSGHLHLAHGFEWLGTWPAFIALSIATLFEVFAYFIPWFDNLLDAVTTPAAVVAGTILTAANIDEMSPFMHWALAAIAGGGVAGVVQAGTVTLRGASTALTGGFGNFLVSLAELFGAAVMSFLALVFSVLGMILVVALCAWLASRVYFRLGRGAGRA
jgi:phosphoglycerol transferase MdoB-like AlkP superfamily enzyme